ncbi:MAG: hypothetical protein ACLPKW_00130 [Acetobacteraceae bacterium]|jgi:hypothetical protein
MAAARRPEPPTSAEAETSASHAVMELVRTNSALVSLWFSYVMRASHGVT